MTESPNETPRQAPRASAAKNLRLGLILGSVAVGMVGMSFAAVPLYRIFCQVTGFGGTTQVAKAAPEEAADRWITVRFNSDTARDLPWEFRPMQREVKVRVGEEALVFYEATNRGSAPTTGTAAYNVTPLKTGVYFAKVACFCFEEQELAPGERMEFPVSFFVDPSLVEDRDQNDVNTITLSYTFFRAKNDGEIRDTAQLSAGGTR